MRIVYLLLTILLGIHFFITFGLLLLSYYKNSKYKKIFFIVLIMNIFFFLIWGFLRNVDPPFWA